MEPDRQDAETVVIGSSDLARGVLAGVGLLVMSGTFLWFVPTFMALYGVGGGL